MAIARLKRGSSSEHPTRRQVVVWVGGRCLALPIAGVREVVDTLHVTPVPHAPPNVLGIASLRGTVLSIVDAEGLLFERPATQAPSKVLVLTRDSAVVTGLTVDRVHGVVALAQDRALRDHVPERARFVLAHHDLGFSDLVAEIDLPGLFAHLDSLRFAAATGSHTEGAHDD